VKVTSVSLVSNQLAEHHLAFKFHTDINQADANDEYPGLKTAGHKWRTTKTDYSRQAWGQNMFGKTTEERA
jgi:hypothetical protein